MKVPWQASCSKPAMIQQAHKLRHDVRGNDVGKECYPEHSISNGKAILLQGESKHFRP
ncbi:hypothetical protein X727_05445 [Mesorhizobium sp. L103C119B0]|nr:hypothetical protein X727_05445 [Mesorhizobium sp. L103C119B0]